MSCYRRYFRSVVALGVMVGVLVPAEVEASLVSAVLPGSRSVQVGDTATAFATVINTGNDTANDCLISPLSSIAADFYYQATDPATNAPMGDPDTPVDIAAGALQSFVIGFTPTEPIAPTEVELLFDCSNRDPALSIPGVNSLLLSASDTPVADMIALAATLSNDGIVAIPNATGTGVFSVATVNNGAAATISVSADTGGATLPVSPTLCETDPASGMCINPGVPVAEPVTVTVAAGATPTFAVFVIGRGEVVADAAANRVYVRFTDGGGVTRGATSVAAETVPTLLDVEPVVELAIAQQGGDGQATLAILAAMDNGYSLREITDAIIGGTMTADGEIVGMLLGQHHKADEKDEEFSEIYQQMVEQVDAWMSNFRESSSKAATRTIVLAAQLGYDQNQIIMALWHGFLLKDDGFDFYQGFILRCVSFYPGGRCEEFDVWPPAGTPSLVFDPFLIAETPLAIGFQNLPATFDPLAAFFLDVRVTGGVPDTDGQNQTYTVTLDWGDGTTETEAVGAGDTGATLETGYIYDKAGTYTIKATVVDAFGATASVSREIVVGEVPPLQNAVYLFVTLRIRLVDYPFNMGSFSTGAAGDGSVMGGGLDFAWSDSGQGETRSFTLTGNWDEAFAITAFEYDFDVTWWPDVLAESQDLTVLGEVPYHGTMPVSGKMAYTFQLEGVKTCDVIVSFRNFVVQSGEELSWSDFYCTSDSYLRLHFLTESPD